MLTCEKCRAQFTPAKGVVEVTTLSVLCPPCLAEHQAAKLARKAGKLAAPAPRPERPVAAPAPKLERPVAVPGPKLERPAAAPAPKPERPAAATATTTAPKAAARAQPQEELPEPPAEKHRPSRPAAGGRGRRDAKKEAHEARQRNLQISSDLKKKGKREVLFAFTGAGVVMVLAGVVLMKVLAQKRTEAAEIQARQEQIDAFRTEFMGVDIQTEEGARRLLTLAEEGKAEWENEDFASDVINRQAKAKTFLEGLEEQRALTQRLEEIEGALARASELTPSELAEQRRRLDELSSKAQLLGAEFVARVAKDRTYAEETYLEGLQAAARTAAATEPLDRAGLATIQQAEDEILKIFEASYRAWQGDAQDPEKTARKNADQERYQALIKLSDDAVQRFFTPEVVESTPWRDLLSPEHAGEWKGPTLKGFEHRIENGVLHMIGPDPSEGAAGIISVGDKENWRDFVVDAEFTITKGDFNFFFRLPPAYQENVESINMTTAEGALEAGRAYAYTFDVIGSTLVDQEHGEFSSGPNAVPISWTKVRKGAFAISVPRDTEVRFTRLRVKVLR